MILHAENIKQLPVELKATLNISVCRKK